MRLALVTSVACTPPSVPPVRFHNPGVRRAEQQVAGVGSACAGAVDVLEDPGDLGAGEISVYKNFREAKDFEEILVRLASEDPDDDGLDGPRHARAPE